MNPMLCTRCHKNIAVVFVTRFENGESKNEGLCLKCAKELGIKPVEDMMQKMGISDEDLDNLTGEMMSALQSAASGMEGLVPRPEEGDDPDTPGDDEDEGRTATFPFLSKLMGNMPPAAGGPRSRRGPGSPPCRGCGAGRGCRPASAPPPSQRPPGRQRGRDRWP